MTATAYRDAIILKILSTLLFAVMSTCVRLSTVEVPTGQIVFFRSVFALLPLVVYLTIRGQFPSGLATRRPGTHSLRSLFGCGAMFLAFTALAYLPQANATVLSFLSPLILMIAGGLFLKEKPHPLVYAAGAIGFGGIILTVLPALQGPEIDRATLIGTAAGILGAAFTASAMSQLKRLTHTEQPGAIALYFTLTSSVLGAATWFLGDWVIPGLSTTVLLISVGLLGGAAQIAMTEAFARAPASVVAPLEYTSMLWALTLDALVFRLLPDPVAFGGVVLIVLSAILATIFGRRSR